MATDTEITREQLEMIEKQAKEKYSVQMDAINLNNQVIEYDYNEPIREVYIAAKTEDAIEIKVLREALEQIHASPCPQNEREIQTWMQIVREISIVALTNYNESLKG